MFIQAGTHCLIRWVGYHILVHRTGGEKRAAETSETWKEWRRRRALELHEAGWTQALIAQALGVTEAAVSQWFKMVKESGPEALKPKTRQGQGAWLSEEQLRKLPAVLDRGPESFGFSGELWTCPRIARVIEHEFGVLYDPDHVRRLMHRLDWTCQTPVLRASQREEARILDWLTRVWPAMLKSARKEARTIVFIDESGFYLGPVVVPTRAMHGRSSRGELVKSSFPTLWGPGLCPPLCGSPQRGFAPPLRGSPPTRPVEAPSLGLRFSTEKGRRAVARRLKACRVELWAAAATSYA